MFQTLALFTNSVEAMLLRLVLMLQALILKNFEGFLIGLFD
jgi:hypothetical protein